MDKQISTITLICRQFFLVLWLIFSTIVYSIVCLALCLFSKKAARWISIQWNKHLLFFSGVKVKTIGLEKLDKNGKYIFIANHQSAYDIFTLIVGLQPIYVTFVAKKELFLIPFFGWGITALGHIWIDRSNTRKALKSIDRASRILRKGTESLALFPEGTRSLCGDVGKFRHGSFILPIRTGIAVVPVAICGTFDVLAKNSRIVKPGIVTLIVGTPVETTGMETSQRDLLSEKVRAEIISMIEQYKKSKSVG